MRLLVLLHKV